MGKISAKITTVIFVAIIAVFSLMSIFKPDRTFSSSENRYLAQKPEFSVKSLFDGTYTSKYEEYVTDQFVFRDGFITMKTMSEIGVGKKDVNGVYIAKDGYLVEVHPQTGIEPTRAKNNADRMIAFINEMKQVEGMQDVSIMIIPTAVMTLKDKLPPFATTYDQNELIDYIADGTDDAFVDVRTVLAEHADEYIYYRTDHHWTTDGAYLAYEQWAKKAGLEPFGKDAFNIHPVSEDFLGTLYSKINYSASKDTITVYETKEDYDYYVSYNFGQEESDTLYNPAALETKDQYTYFLKGNQAAVEISTNVDNDRKLLIIKDSYAHCFAPFTANHYEEVIMIDMRYLKKPVHQIVEEYGVTDILVLYNAIHFATDTSMSLLQ